MIERVATAMSEHFMQIIEVASGGSFSESGVTLPSKHVWAGYAEAAVKAMREPTNGMKDAACKVGPDTNCGEFDYDNASDVYQAMIDAALTCS